MAIANQQCGGFLITSILHPSHAYGEHVSVTKVTDKLIIKCSIELLNSPLHMYRLSTHVLRLLLFKLL